MKNELSDRSGIACDFLFHECKEMLGSRDFAMGFTIGTLYSEMCKGQKDIIEIITDDREKEIAVELGRRLGYFIIEDADLGSKCNRLRFRLSTKHKDHLCLVEKV